MPEYIERDNLVGKFLEKQFSGTSNLIHIAEAIRLTNKQPTADVVEVKHGKWTVVHEHIHLTSEKTAEWDNCFCSVCDCPQTFLSNYCPNCGAKMDKE